MLDTKNLQILFGLAPPQPLPEKKEKVVEVSIPAISIEIIFNTRLSW
jgi:hypothetical protein